MPHARDTAAAAGAIDAIWRIESPRLIAGLARILRDVGAAEDAAQDALVRALETWPRDGVPDNPGAWLMTSARRIAFDRLRRAQTFTRKQDELEWLAGSHASTSTPETAVDDDLLSLMFTCCHPVLSRSARITLTLRLLGGLRTDEIARAFLTSEATIAQRISRAKRTLADADVGFAPPAPEDIPARLDAVLEVLYLVFNEGHTATSGDDWLRADLCFDALRLARTLAALAPHEPEVHGLVALMDFQASRLRARTAPDGTPILLMDQNRSRWDRTLITHGLAAMRAAERCPKPGGPYLAQAAIAACHASAPTAAATDWIRIAALYEALLRLQPSPIVELNRAVAVSHAFGPAAALPLIDTLIATDLLSTSHLLPAVRADLLIRLNRPTEAHTDLLHAATLTHNLRERELLLARAAALGDD
ncbi:RNA polymerase sigma factor [Baekduia sp. Peel2402]|uniref:RNA polymerase sigma factor n=1 Tax=Baekduia sp. Peel2402 TaxID=3458296 RepID=UPI00403E9241